MGGYSIASVLFAAVILSYVDSAPVVFCQQQAPCLIYSETCGADGKIRACIRWDSNLPGCIKDPPTISHVCEAEGVKVDAWNANAEFCVDGKDPNSPIVFGVKDGNPNSQQQGSNTGGKYVITGYLRGTATCGSTLEDVCIPGQDTQTEARWTFMTGECSVIPSESPGPVVFCNQQAPCLQYRETCGRDGKITACIRWDSNLSGCSKEPPSISHVCEAGGEKLDGWNVNSEFCVDGKDANSLIVFGVKDGSTNAVQGSNMGGIFTITGYINGMATCGAELGDVCVPGQTRATEARWTFMTGNCGTSQT